MSINIQKHGKASRQNDMSSSGGGEILAIGTQEPIGSVPGKKQSNQINRQNIYNDGLEMTNENEVEESNSYNEYEDDQDELDEESPQPVDEPDLVDHPRDSDYNEMDSPIINRGNQRNQVEDHREIGQRKKQQSMRTEPKKLETKLLTINTEEEDGQFMPAVVGKQKGSKNDNKENVRNVNVGAEDLRTSQQIIEVSATSDDYDDLKKKVRAPQQPLNSLLNSHQSPVLEKSKKMKADPLYNEAILSKEGIMNQISQKEFKLKAHERKIGQYILGKTIGEGTFGKVKIGMHILTKNKVAVKILEKSKIVDVADVERVSREIHILKIVQHPQVVQLYEIIETQKKLYLIMEYASGGELFDYIVKHQKVQEKEACLFFQQLLSGIEYTSRLNIVHRDLKPENLLLDYDKGIKIVDFGLSNTYKTGELLKTACGSPCYAAPEMIAGKKYNGTNVDLWSCGVILFALICGYLPFEDPDTSKLYKKILSADFHTPDNISEEAKDLLNCILNTDPEKRYTISQIRKHPWFNIVPCESNFKGILVGTDPVPIDNTILDQMQRDYGIDKNYASKCIQANKHNQISASYYLLLKELIKTGGTSIADVRSPDYNPKLFVQTTKTIQQAKLREKLENTSMQDQSVNDENNKDDNANVSDEDLAGVSESDTQSPNREGQQASKAYPEIVNEKVSRSPKKRDEITAPNNTSQQVMEKRNKSTQPQKLRKIADGLLEFERYADRKKRLQNIQKKQKDQERVKEMNLEISKNAIAEDLLSNGGLNLLYRGLSPVVADGTTVPGDTMSYDGGEINTLQYSRDISPSLSPHSMRLNAQRGNMSTQYGNFLYQDNKQFPGSQMNANVKPQLQDQFHLNALKNQQHIQALNNYNATSFNIQQVNSKQIHKQLKQLYIHQKKTDKSKNGSLYNQEVILKNLVNNQGNPNMQNSNQQMAQLSKIQHLQQNYQKQNKKNQQNFSTIQTAYDTLQQNLTNTLVLNNSAASGKSKKGSNGVPFFDMKQQMMLVIANASGGQINIKGNGNHHRYNTQNFNGNLKTIQQHMLESNQGQMNNMTASGAAQTFMNGQNSASHQQHYNNNRTRYDHNNSFVQNSSMLGINTGSIISNTAKVVGKRKKGQSTVGMSGSLGPGLGIFSPKNLPTNSFGFGYNFNMNNQTTPQQQNQQNHFTIDAQRGNGYTTNLSNQLMQSLQTMQGGQSNMQSLNVNKQSSQHLQPSTSKARQTNVSGNNRNGSITSHLQQLQVNNTLSYPDEKQYTQMGIKEQNSNALFKRRRDQSKVPSKNVNKSAQKYSQYGPLQQTEQPGVGPKKNSSKNNLSMNNSNKLNSNKPPLMNTIEVSKTAQNSQKKISKQRTGNSKSTHGGQQKNLNQSLVASASGKYTNQNISMKRIIETGQNLANMPLNINNNTAVSVKNASLYSPMHNEFNSMPMSPQQQQQMIQFQQQKIQQDHFDNLNKIQHQLQLKKQQKAKLENQNQNPKMISGQFVESAINNSFTAGNPQSISKQNNSQFVQSGFSSPQSNTMLQQKKITLNSSLLTQKYAPHLLLQNYHGNGYPPPLAQNKMAGPQFLTPTGYAAQNASYSGSRRNTPQMQSSLPGPPAGGPALQLSPGEGKGQYSNNLWMKQQLQNQMLGPFPLSAKNTSHPQQAQPFNASALSPLNSNTGHLMTGPPSANFGRASNSIVYAPNTVKNAQKLMDQTDMKNQVNSVLKYVTNNNLQLDNSNIDFQEDVDISNNTIANINQQLSGDQHYGQYVNNNNGNYIVKENSVKGPTKKKQVRVSKKKSVNN